MTCVLEGYEDTVRGKTPRFRQICFQADFCDAIRDENWDRGRGLLLIRHVHLFHAGHAKRAKASVNEGDVVVLGAITCDGVFCSHMCPAAYVASR